MSEVKNILDVEPGEPEMVPTLALKLLSLSTQQTAWATDRVIENEKKRADKAELELAVMRDDMYWLQRLSGYLSDPNHARRLVNMMEDMENDEKYSDNK